MAPKIAVNNGTGSKKNDNFSPNTSKTQLAVIEEDAPEIKTFIGKGGIPPGFYSRICRVRGRIVGAKNLPKADALNASDPYCVLKGIRSNSNLANIHMTAIKWNTTTPTWEEAFDFEVPREWGIEELAGLRVLVYDADTPYRNFTGEDDFLGGADIDISTAASGRMFTHELDMGGVPVGLARGGQKAKIQKKGRIILVVTVYREVIPKPMKPQEILDLSMQNFTYIREVVGTVVKASNLPNMDSAGLSDPVCIVRVLLASGKFVELHRTRVIYDELEPVWDEDFRYKFHPLDQPLLIMFDLFDEDDPSKPVEEDGDHLGTAIVPLFSTLPPAPRRRNLWLQGETQLHETRHNQYGTPANEVKLKRSKEGISPMERKLLKRMEQLQSQIMDKADALMDPEEIARQIEELKDPKGMIERAQSMMEERGQVAPKKTMFGMVEDAVMALIGQYAEFKPSDRAVLTVQLRARTKSEPMPFKHWHDKSMVVADLEDVEEASSHPDWARTAYPMPPEIDFENQHRLPPRGEMRGEDHIKFIYGFINGASALPRADAVNKNDVYCLMQCLGKEEGQKFFMHRTRVIKDTICPNWSEAFYFAVPYDCDVKRVIISIFALPVTVSQMIGASLMKGINSIGSAIEGNEEDAAQEAKDVSSQVETLLGRANFDLSYVQSGTVVEQEVQLQGGNYKTPQEKVSTGLRRQATVHFEIIIERQVRPCYLTDQTGAIRPIPRREHKITRNPYPDRGFLDHGQADPQHDLSEAAAFDGTAADVRELMLTQTMLTDGSQRVADMGQQDWTSPKIDDALHKKKIGVDEEKEEQEPEKQKKSKLPKLAAQRKQELQRSVLQYGSAGQILDPQADFTVRVPLQRGKSLPALKTKFGETPNDAFLRNGTLEEIPQVKKSSFNDVNTAPALRSLAARPDVNELLKPVAPNGA
eukprot:CAMPEP_0197701386 /NCGR_PEP_ID=MMETSP1338-20131121/123129_1 /TAXON_ID=43686 ORGANISM="Pelagodinium beii, Strain RCC1491" /NCGR_SAMPLE_ID=MMETSP1338 /ASSEMBLY_ACC=CAM_ASM_000754 /LENGTH=928 /DNA_ID=CAMNT_0043285077 /DNA_START=27 /DNA_END=2810 /DNA_ORIENTATION=+